MNKRTKTRLGAAAWILISLFGLASCGGGGGSNNGADTGNGTARYTITFDKNDADATGAMVNQTVPGGTAVSLTACGFSKPGWTFARWAPTSVGGYIDQASYTIAAANVTLYAQWGFWLRDIGPAGGWIFYDKGYYSDGWRYLEAAPDDQTASAWGTNNFYVCGTGTVIGSGEWNTALMLVDPYTGSVADRCAAYDNVNNGIIYTDWFLPSSDELNEMYVNLKAQGVGGFIDNNYWSSSGAGDTNASCQFFNNGKRSNDSKTATYNVRAVRAF